VIKLQSAVFIPYLTLERPSPPVEAVQLSEGVEGRPQRADPDSRDALYRLGNDLGSRAPDLDRLAHDR
jgi:hypothetical protein